LETGKPKKVLCPYCWNVFLLPPAPGAGATPEPAPTAAPQGARSAGGPSAWVRRLLRRDGAQPAHVPRPSEIEDTILPQCPHCKRSLPRAYEYSRPLLVGLVGGPGSGKTHYLASLIRQLDEMADLSLNGCTRFAAIGDTIEIYRRYYYEPLFGRREPPGRTPQVRKGLVNEPLMYEMDIERGGGDDERDTYVVLFFDASGEQLDIPRERDLHHKYLYHADAFVVFADPFAMPGALRWIADADEPLEPTPAPVGDGTADGAEVAASEENAASGPEERRRWRYRRAERGPAATEDGGNGHATEATGTGPEPRSVVGSHLHQLVVDVTGSYQRSRGRRSGDSIDVPAAVVISKGDELRYVPRIADAASALLPRPTEIEDAVAGRTSPFRLMELLESSGDAQRVLGAIAVPALQKALGQFAQISYHVVSATGCRPQREPDGAMRYPHVTPQRVVDPFAALLLRLEVIGGAR
jgi:hypothetical protein